MHLTRWQRMIGVVASICWFIGATTWINVSVTDQLQKQAVREYHDCQKKAPEDRPACSVKFARDFRPTTHFHCLADHLRARRFGAPDQGLIAAERPAWRCWRQCAELTDRAAPARHFVTPFVTAAPR